MSKSTSRTKGNAYNKVDQSRFMTLPRYQDVPKTSFLEVRKLTLEKYQDDDITEDIDISLILGKIVQKEF